MHSVPERTSADEPEAIRFEATEEPSLTEELDTTGATTSDDAAPRAALTRKSQKANAIVRQSLRASRAGASKRRPARTAGIAIAVTGMLATVAVPAYAALTGSQAETAEASSVRTVQQEAASGAQTYVVGSEVESKKVSRDSYSATSAEEIEQKKAEEAAAARAAELEKQAAERSAMMASIDLSAIPKGSGTATWPLATIQQIGEGFMARGGAHQGIDFVDPAGTPIYAATDGVVKVSSESYYGYGVGVVITTNMGGSSIDTVYGHMTYGSRMVEQGQQVKAGDIIGLVGSTGFSTGPHLHFEVHANGSAIDPYQWLLDNAG